MKVFFDTNVVLDFLLRRESSISEDSIRALDYCTEAGNTIAVSSLSPATVYYFLRKSIGMSEALRVVSLLRKDFEILSVGVEEVDWSIANNPKDFEDGLQLSCGLAQGCDQLLTRNAKDFLKTTAVKVLTPAEFLTEATG